MIPPTPRYFGSYALPYAYDPAAPPPAQWLRFLDQVLPGDVEAVRAIQEWYGYCLTADTSQHKIMLLVGESRGGKGTIGHVLRHLVGEDNAATPSLRGLVEGFGLAPLVGKPVAVLGDVRLGGKTDIAAITERMLMISGGDGVEANVKNKPQFSMRLPTRFTLISDELPLFPDASGAIAGRLIIINFRVSFLGREDVGLLDRIISDELPGILNWSLAGLARLRARGKFRQPASSAGLLAALTESASPIKSFLADECQIDPDLNVTKDALYDRWRAWCEAQGRDYPGNKNHFGVALLAALPGLQSGRITIEGKRVHSYKGLSLRQPSDLPEPEDTPAERIAWVRSALDRFRRMPAPRHMVCVGYEGTPNLLGVPTRTEPGLALGDYIRRLLIDPDHPSGRDWLRVRARFEALAANLPR